MLGTKSVPMDQAEISRLIHQHSQWLKNGTGEPVDFSYTDLSGGTLSHANLKGVSFQGAQLAGTSLIDCELSNANMRHVNAIGAVFNDAHAPGADFTGACLRRASFTNTYLCEANFDGASLFEASFTAATLRGANLILGGQDIRGYLFYAYRDRHGKVQISAGCRRFGIESAISWWSQRHSDDPLLREDCLALVARLQRMAVARGWIE